jgi:hypothetical protein
MDLRMSLRVGCADGDEEMGSPEHRDPDRS